MEGFANVSIKGTVVICVIVNVIFLLIRNKFGSKHLRNIPGPFVAGFTRYWQAYQVLNGKSEKPLLDEHRRHGSLVRISPNKISVSDPAALSQIYSPDEKFVKSAFYPIQSITWKKEPAYNLFSTTSPAEHRKLMRQSGPAYALSNVLQSEAEINDCLDLLITQLSKQSSKALDLNKWLRFFAFDAMGCATFAKRFGFLDTGKDIDDIGSAIRAQVGYAAIVGQVPEWHMLLLGNKLLGKMMRPLEDWNAVLIFCLNAMRARTEIRNGEVVGESDKNGVDMVTKWSRVDESNPHRMNERDLMVALTSNVFAGADTIATACSGIIYHLLRNPDAKRKVIAEIRTADKAGLLSARVSHKEASTHLPYTCAAIKEGQRMHPSIGLILERVCPFEGATIADKYLPGGTIVGMSPYVLFRDQTLFPQPESFQPERWLVDAGSADDKSTAIRNAAEQIAQRERVLGFNFGYGSRTCVGKNIAQIEMLKVVPELFRRFEIELEKPEREWRTTNHWFVFQDGWDVTMKAL